MYNDTQNCISVSGLKLPSRNRPSRPLKRAVACRML